MQPLAQAPGQRPYVLRLRCCLPDLRFRRPAWLNLSKSNSAARVLAVYASRRRLLDDLQDSLSDGGPTFSDWGFDPMGYVTRFLHALALHDLLLVKAFLTHRKRIEPLFTSSRAWRDGLALAILGSARA